MSQSTLREVLGMASRPGVISFAIGLPAEDLFPAAALAETAARLIATDPRALQYAVPYQPLKAQVVELMARRGVACREEQVFLTSGSQQGMDLFARLLLEPGGQAMIERTVYDGLQMAIKRLEPRILPCPTDIHTGIDVDAVEALLEGGADPAFLYVITDGHNPLGVSVSPEKRPPPGGARPALSGCRSWRTTPTASSATRRPRPCPCAPWRTSGCSTWGRSPRSSPRPCAPAGWWCRSAWCRRSPP